MGYNSLSLSICVIKTAHAFLMYNVCLEMPTNVSDFTTSLRQNHSKHADMMGQGRISIRSVLENILDKHCENMQVDIHIFSLMCNLRGESNPTMAYFEFTDGMLRMFCVTLEVYC